MRRDRTKNTVYRRFRPKGYCTGCQRTAVDTSAGGYPHKPFVIHAGYYKTDFIHMGFQHNRGKVLPGTLPTAEHISEAIGIYFPGVFTQQIFRSF